MQIPEALLDRRRNLLAIQPFQYPINFSALATATSADGSFTTDNDSDFIIMKTTYYASLVTTAALTESTQIRPLATVLLVDSSSGRQLSSGAVQITGLFGDGKLPYIWTMPYKVPGNGTITATLANYSSGGGESYTVRLLFHGVKVFYGGLR